MNLGVLLQEIGEIFVSFEKEEERNIFGYFGDFEKVYIESLNLESVLREIGELFYFEEKEREERIFFGYPRVYLPRV